MLRDAGDIVDRLCIATLKAERIGTPEAKKELRGFWEGLFPLFLIYPHFDWWQTINDMYNLHRRIWDLESDIRKDKLNHDEREVGRRTIILTEWNKVRIAKKNNINIALGEGYCEQKKDHPSEL
jgi:hypothetical protein